VIVHISTAGRWTAAAVDDAQAESDVVQSEKCFFAAEFRRMSRDLGVIVVRAQPRDIHQPLRRGLLGRVAAFPLRATVRA